jgi:tetratricopeptide (TPR) repeat protein
MNRLELRGFPRNSWIRPSQRINHQEAEAFFTKALNIDPDNRSALFRMGLIAMQRSEYLETADLLEKAYQQDPDHRGVRKALAYSLVWMGDLKGAAPLLEDIREARAEMRAYAAWWRSQEEPDLSEKARQAVELLRDR